MPISSNPPLWDTLLDAEMNSYYWAKISRRFLRNARWLKFTVAITSSGTAIAALSIWQTHPRTWQAVAVGSCVLSVYQSSIVPEDRIKKSAALAATWKELATRYNLLWMHDRNLSSQISVDDFSSMKIRESALDETEFTVNRKFLYQARDEVLKARGLS
jgi:hypothetical protein